VPDTRYGCSVSQPRRPGVASHSRSGNIIKIKTKHSPLCNVPISWHFLNASWAQTHTSFISRPELKLISSIFINLNLWVPCLATAFNHSSRFVNQPVPSNGLTGAVPRNGSYRPPVHMYLGDQSRTTWDAQHLHRGLAQRVITPGLCAQDAQRPKYMRLSQRLLSPLASRL